MRAMMVTAIGGPEVLQPATLEIPMPKENQVLIRVVATSVNFADIKSRVRGPRGGKLPFIPGLDVAGVVAAVGAAVRGIQVGERVIAFPKAGSYAEYVVTDEALTFAIDDSIDFETAAACPIVSFTAYMLLADVARVQPGETVLIHAAAGGVGTTAIQLAKLLGAGLVIGTVGSEAKRAIASEAGADVVILHEQTDFADRVRVATDGRGADVILDSIAGRVFERSLECLANYGRLVQFGDASGEAGYVPSSALHSSCRSVLGFSLGTTRQQRPHLLQAPARQILRYLADGKLNIKIGRKFALEQAAEAQSWVESRQSIGKVLLQVGEAEAE